VIIKKTFYLCK